VQSKNKKTMTAAERKHVAMIKEMNCVICDASGPSEAHEPEQGLWWVSIPLCADCHRGSVNGWHGQKVMWNIHKMDEIKAINLTIQRLLG